MAYLSLGEEKLHYLKMGNGSKLLLAFHGYAESAVTLSLFEPYLKEDYTILLFDLPYHGGSRWDGAKKLTKEHLSLLIDTVKDKYSVSKVSLMGYSMGGRVCLNIIVARPESIERVLLMATDGLRINRFYYFFTRKKVGVAIFNYMVNRPESAIRIISWLHRFGRLPTTHFKIAKGTIGNKYTRNMLKKAWPATSLLILPPDKIKTAIRSNGIPVSIFMGRYDKLLPPHFAETFAEGMDSVKVFVLEKGHRIFDESNVREIAQHLL